MAFQRALLATLAESPAGGRYLANAKSARTVKKSARKVITRLTPRP